MGHPTAAQWAETRLHAVREWEKQNPYPNFIFPDNIRQTLADTASPSPEEIRDIIQKARNQATSGQLLDAVDVAKLCNCQDPELWEAIFETANWIKRTVYGNRVVLFAPLYIASHCVNNCAYCGFRKSNTAVQSTALNREELERETLALVREGHKRLIAVYGEHPVSDVDYMCETIETIYQTRENHDEIRRVNVNAAPLHVDEYRQVHDIGIGTYQVFQETYDPDMYSRVHPKNTIKGQYDWRVFSLHRALEAGIDDVAIGALFGLTDWRFEMMGLHAHAAALEDQFNIGPHTISYPRLEPALNTPLAIHPRHRVSDDDFKKIVAIIRLMCPYTGSILTAREESDLRMDVLENGGVSQMDAGSRIALGGYARMEQDNIPDEEQFMIQDTRNLDEFILDLCKRGYLPSFCTAGYREGRTGANFMPLAKHASVKYFCIANGILTFQEYLLDHASETVRQIGTDTVIPSHLTWLESEKPDLAKQVVENLERMNHQSRDLHF